MLEDIEANDTHWRRTWARYWIMQNWIMQIAAQNFDERFVLADLDCGSQAVAALLVELGRAHEARRLADLRGKRALLLTFFPQCFSGNCTNQVISLRDNYAELQRLGVEVWAVSTDSAQGPHGQRAFAERYQLPFALLPDTEREICLPHGAVRATSQMAARMSWRACGEQNNGGNQNGRYDFSYRPFGVCFYAALFPNHSGLLAVESK